MDYTKGEWKVRPCDDNNAEVVFDDPEPCISIYTPNDGEAPANANLIASAPDLYEALKNLIDNGLIVGIDSDHFQECIDAIEKAEGK
jgi:hypothetical protein